MLGTETASILEPLERGQRRWAASPVRVQSGVLRSWHAGRQTDPVTGRPVGQEWDQRTYRGVARTRRIGAPPLLRRRSRR